MVLTVSPERIELPPGSEVTLRYQTWADYEALLESRHDDAAIKIQFNAYTQEISIMAPLAGHGRRIDSLVDLVKALLRHRGRDWDSSHPVTLKRFQAAGAEPDACFYIQNWQAVLGKDRIDLSEDLPPDLAIEMDLTSLTDLAIYRALNVPEVWIYRQGSLAIHAIAAEGYRASSTSPTFPDIDVKNLLPQYVERSWAAGSSVALREFEQLLKSL
ncbi:Uma2 family endonuclease [Synechococcus sp. PCC 7336]|uniref:Uma2 family endonuclease n=1 Tax=Synechococcus sp. PCC 7336 TaxID=195250 RepID=UPI00034D9B6B|nr:Uma2 family endonuclease [Synechococcus sp. PCC 7336]